MVRLPDTRRFGAESSAIGIPGFAAGAPPTVEAFDRLLRQGDDSTLYAVLRSAPDARTYARLWQALCEAVDRPSGAEVAARAFALPVVVIASAERDSTIPGVLPDVGEIAALFERHGALGPTRNFGLANVLCAPETLEAIAPSAVLHWAQPDALHPAPKQIAPGAIGVAKGSEQAHLRFLVGAGIAPADAPSLFETAANIGAWGKPLAQCLGRQLAQPGLQLLALPRPPQNLLAARHAGRFAQLEVAMQLFVSNAVRTIRRSSGDPVAIVAAHDNGDLRVTLSSPFNVGVVEGFRWPLHPLDDLADIERRMLRLLDECRVGDVRVIEAAMPDRDENGRTLYLQPRNTARFTASH